MDEEMKLSIEADNIKANEIKFGDVLIVQMKDALRMGHVREVWSGGSDVVVAAVKIDGIPTMLRIEYKAEEKVYRSRPYPTHGDIDYTKLH